MAMSESRYATLNIPMVYHHFPYYFVVKSHSFRDWLLVADILVSIFHSSSELQ